LKTVEDINRKEKDDPDTHFCLSLVGILNSLPSEQNALAKIKIQQLLFDLKYNV